MEIGENAIEKENFGQLKDNILLLFAFELSHAVPCVAFRKI